MAPLVEDLQSLWIDIEAYDAYRAETFLLRAVLLWTINYSPAYGNLSGCYVKGYRGCPICGKGTYAKMLKHSRKMSFTCHKRFLHRNHPYRKQKRAFDGKQEPGLAPKPLTGHDILKRVVGIKWNCGEKSRDLQTKDEKCKTYWKKKSIFFDLEYWEDLHVRHILDVMHIEKNICESLIGTLLNIPGKTKNGIAARKDLVEMKVRVGLAPIVEEKRTFLPAASYTLHKELKSHDCHTLMQLLLPVAIRGVLPNNVRHTITKLYFFFNVPCSKTIYVLKLEICKEISQRLCFYSRSIFLHRSLISWFT